MKSTKINVKCTKKELLLGLSITLFVVAYAYAGGDIHIYLTHGGWEHSLPGGTHMQTWCKHR